MIYALESFFLGLMLLRWMKKYAPNPELSKNAHVTNMDEYKKLYENSINNPEGFWEEQANRISWFKKWNIVWRP